MLVASTGVGIPEFYRRVDIEHAPLMAPLDDFTTLDIPCEVDEEVPGRDMLAQQRTQILWRHTVPNEYHPLFEPGSQSGLVRLKIDKGDMPRTNGDVLEQYR
jgi:hypothetical protein